MEDAVVYDLFNQQFMNALQGVAHSKQSEDQDMAASVLHLILMKPEAVHLIDKDYKEATIIEHWNLSLCETGAETERSRA
ncbi:hypothetical protein [Shouchella patagoniensis]|uniref:hypothetical protein n=1 Tax=Shouchella patagoniensis TaxID=228576 RepID=UPI00099530E1|nr:hypothetical protein [Shouchella patagoniensis]